MRIRSVIGAGYGDEGKGLAVDALAHEALSSGEATVVRVNGGAQAGHTVQTPDGRRHVFHQFGAGSLADLHDGRVVQGLAVVGEGLALELRLEGLQGPRRWITSAL